MAQHELLEWLSAHTAPWSAAINDDNNFELLTLAWLVFFVVVRQLTISLASGSSAPRSGLATELLKRPTVVPVTLHSFLVTISAAAVIIPPGRPDEAMQPMAFYWWRRVVLPFSSAYWLFDLYFYCWRANDYLIAVHHLIILMINYPIGDTAGYAALGQMMPRCNLVMMSTNGYAMELTTFLLYEKLPNPSTSSLRACCCCSCCYLHAFLIQVRALVHDHAHVGALVGVYT